MSQTGLGADVYMTSAGTQSWTWTWDDAGWQGNTIIQPQPNSRYTATMSYTNPTVNVNVNGQYQFSFSITADRAVLYNLQVSNS